MTLIKRNNASKNSFNGLLDSFFNEGFMPSWTGINNTPYHYLPAVNVKENESSFELALEAPGFDKGDFKVELDHDRLTISAEAKVENEESNERYTRREFRSHSFSRSFVLGENLVDGDKISAKYENGILNIDLPKREEAKPAPAKMIEIK